MKSKLQSRKLWVAVLGAAVAAFANQLGMSHQDVNEVVKIVMAYLGAQGVHDVAQSWNQEYETEETEPVELKAVGD